MSSNKKVNKKELSTNKPNIIEENIEKEESKDELTKDKINKPNDLKYFDAIAHFKENITHYDKNCSEPVKDYSYYCFSCKHSVCNECGVYDHKEHLLIQRDNCLNYDKTFFNEIAKVIEKGTNIDSEKSQIKKNILTSIQSLKNELDLLEKEKLKEIDKMFNAIKNNYIQLKENFLKTKESIENYYKINKKFFNIKMIITSQEKNNEINNNNNNNKKSSLSNDSCVNNISNLKSYLYENEIGPNKDIENTIFLMNFELMNLCDNKNLDILDISNNIKTKIRDISHSIEQKTKILNEEIKNNYLNFETESITAKFDDFYWDVKIRCEKYNEHINQFKNTLYDIYKHTGSFDKLRDLLCLFDSKNHKGKDILFNQQFFIKMNDLSSLNPEKGKNMSKNLYKSSGKIRNSIKNRLNRQNSQNSSTIKNKDSKGNEKISSNLNVNVNANVNKGIDKYSSKVTNESKKEMRRSYSNLFGRNSISQSNTIPVNIINKDNIILDQRILQRFFAYSILDFYSRYFKFINTDHSMNFYINNLIYNENNDKNNMKNTSKNSARNSAKNTARSNDKNSGRKSDNNKNNGKNSARNYEKNNNINSFINNDISNEKNSLKNSIINNNYKNENNTAGKNKVLLTKKTSKKKPINNRKINNIKSINNTYNSMNNIKYINNNNEINYNADHYTVDNSYNKNKPLKLNKNNSYIKSVSLISNYSERYMELKEKVKPIIGTNYVQFFEPATNRITKVQIPLTKEKHGYLLFPEGCRHILINTLLFITGGTDNCGFPINIVLMLNIEKGEITRIGNLNDNHSYHSIEYLENFDSLILIGGENSSSCEIMDLDSKKWTNFPSLNFPRANVNIYYNNITSDLFALFGMEGKMNEKVQNTDIIEVLELNDIVSGWMKVDYYKSVGFDMKNNYCITLPFTKDKLIVYGGSTARSLEKKIFALFDMIKNEIIKVDSHTMDLIKLEENKIRSFDMALQKLM